MKRIARLLARQVSLLAIAPILFAVCRVAEAAGEPAAGMAAVQHTNQVKAPISRREQAFKLLDQYAATRNQLNSFILKDKGSCEWDAHYNKVTGSLSINCIVLAEASSSSVCFGDIFLNNPVPFSIRRTFIGE